MHLIVDLNVVPVAGTMHIRNILLINNSRRAIVPGCSSKIAAVCYCLNSSICKANDTQKNRNRDLNDGRVHDGDLNDGRVRGGDLNDGRVYSNDHDIMDQPDVATKGLNASTSR